MGKRRGSPGCEWAHPDLPVLWFFVVGLSTWSTGSAAQFFPEISDFAVFFG